MPKQEADATPLLTPAITLSAGSLAWTTWSLVDLLGAGPIGLTVAAGADIIWASVIVAEARSLRIAGHRWPVAAIGWAALLAVGTFLVWHGIARDHTAMPSPAPPPHRAKLVLLPSPTCATRPHSPTTSRPSSPPWNAA
ncbi:hypothetical protein [Streptomyces filamentosus]|uniref:hypothetical protein n=1 Tax=Streptomyces filamentosus TaxID=67294 RepID=UPI00123ABB34|nr:hypothetical protein [Streptomyces filamentosus]KAA6211764.1 hypothetical protein CP979_35935 [Streptomyces filamentosus]